MRCTIGSDMARLRAPAPFVGRATGGAALGANCDPPLTILNFSCFPVARAKASCTMLRGPSPSATSTITCDIATFTDTSWPRTLHSPDSRLWASICCPASSKATKTALRARAGVTSVGASAGCSTVATATATAVGESTRVLAAADSLGETLNALTGGSASAGASALGSLLRLRSASNGDGPLNGDDATPRVDVVSGEAARDVAEALRVPTALGFPGSALPPREVDPPGLTASPL